jgi:hypothetical protein
MQRPALAMLDAVQLSWSVSMLLPIPGRDVFLFYDGFEMRAEPVFTHSLWAEARRGARFVYNTLRRRQVRTGFYTWFIMLRRALERAGYRVRVNDFRGARSAPDRPIGAAGYPTVLDKLGSLPNPRLIGPGLYASPIENPNLFDDPRNVLFLQTCAWGEDMFRPWYGERQRPWFGGFDVADFSDSKNDSKLWDVLIYDKIYFDRDVYYPATIEHFRRMLDERGLRHTTIRYGHYHIRDYLKAVRASRSMAFFAHSETQGMAYQECLASNVPIFAWDEGIWPNPIAKRLARQPVPCTSVPYFDERCGLRFKIASMIDDWNRFQERIDAFESRRFIAEEMTLDRSATLYMRAYQETGELFSRVSPNRRGLGT